MIILVKIKPPFAVQNLIITFTAATFKYIEYNLNIGK